MIAPAPIRWLRAHPRLAEALACVLCVALGWAWHRPAAPVIDLHQHEQITTHAEQHQTAAQQVDQHQVAAATTEKHEEKHEAKAIHCTHCKVTRRDASGAVLTIEGARIDTSEIGSLHLDSAARVDVHLDLSSRLLLSMDSRVIQTSTRDLALHQEPAPRPSVALGALTGLSDRGPLYSVQGGYRIAGPVWLRGQLQFGAILAVQLGGEVQW